MEILVLGLNHKTAPLEVREKMSFASQKTEEILKIFEEKQVFSERLLLSTCNRTEIYGVGFHPHEEVREAKRLLGEFSHMNLSEFEDKLYLLRQPESVSHLFSVASGLDSMVVGETEIIGQVKDAYQAAHKNQQTGKVLNALFQRSFKVAKNLRTQTDIGVGRVSVASVAVDLAEKIFENLKNKKALVIGTGEMSAQVARAMISKGALASIVSSRHYERALNLARELGGTAVPFEDYEAKAGEADILIAATLAPLVLIHKEQVRSWMKRRHGRPLFLIDIAMPRNIDSSVEKLDNVYLYNLDDLRGIAEKNRVYRESQIEECLRLVRSQTQHFMEWLGKEFGPVEA